MESMVAKPLNFLLLADVFEKTWNMCFKIYRLGPANLHSVLGLAWQVALKITQIKWDFLTDIDILNGTKRHSMRNRWCYLSIIFEKSSHSD